MLFGCCAPANEVRAAGALEFSTLTLGQKTGRSEDRPPSPFISEVPVTSRTTCGRNTAQLQSLVMNAQSPQRKIFRCCLPICSMTIINSVFLLIVPPFGRLSSSQRGERLFRTNIVTAFIDRLFRQELVNLPTLD